MSSSTSRQPSPLSPKAFEATASWLAAHQKDSGEILWTLGGKSDPWDHVHAAMGLAAAGRIDAARAAYRFMARTQDENGAWAAERVGGAVTRATHETNHAAYLATGLCHFDQATRDRDFLREMWPTLERAIDWVVKLQLESGAIAWAEKKGKVWRAPLITGSSSVHGSLIAALRVAENLDYDRPLWRAALARLTAVLRRPGKVFIDTDLPEKPGRHAMDFYYPVLGGAIRGHAGRELLTSSPDAAAFIDEDLGCRCVRDQPWYTVAESSELVLAFHAVGLSQRASEIFHWLQGQRDEDGAYWTGTTHPEKIRFPEGEKTTWTAATVLLAHDALMSETTASDFFRTLDANTVSIMRKRSVGERAPAARYDELTTTPAE